MHPSQLAEIFESIQRPGKFYAAGAAEIYMPSLEVEGVGQIALPYLCKMVLTFSVMTSGLA